MKKIKYHLDFVNDDKPFELPNWTPKKHEAALNKLDAATKGMTERQKNEERYQQLMAKLEQIRQELKRKKSPRAVWPLPT